MSRQTRTPEGRKEKGRRHLRNRLLPGIGVLVGVLITLGGVSFLAGAAMSGLSSAATFTVEEVRVEGTRFLDPADLLALAQPHRLTKEFVSAGDLEALGERVSAHPLVGRVAVHRSLPASVVIDVEELVPVAFLTGSPVRGVDADGDMLEGVDPPRYGALPFITGIVERDERDRGDALTRAVTVLRKLKEYAPRLLDRVSEVQPRGEGEIALILSGDAVVVRLGELKLDQTLPMVDALVEEGRKRHSPLAEVDLRFRDTVVYRERKGGG